MDDTFTLYDLKVEVCEGDKPFVCSHHAGDYFLVKGENIEFPENRSFSLYGLSAILPLLPAKQRMTDENDWMTTDDYIACAVIGVRNSRHVEDNSRIFSFHLKEEDKRRIRDFIDGYPNLEGEPFELERTIGSKYRNIMHMNINEEEQS